MRALPIDIGLIHFVGIGGIGMSGIAETLHALGYQVQGSDLSENANVLRLRGLGIHVDIGQRAENIERASVLVVSTAVKSDNPEVVAARARLVPVVRRAEMLAELMRLKWSIAVGGTHGKTTTTSLIAAMLDSADRDPTVINGGIINAYGTNARLGEGEWMVVEADESDGTFIKLPAAIAVVTNIDPEHLDFYGTFDAVREAFATFVSNIPFYGFAAMCVDHPEVQALIPQLKDRRIVTYGFSPQADVRGVNLETDSSGMRFDVNVAQRTSSAARTIEGIQLPMFGAHNAQNALAAVTVALEMDIPDSVIQTAFTGFEGVKRRFTKTGEAGGITVIDDYGHHPVEITAVLDAARSATQGRVMAIFQPHRFSRVESLFDEFCTCFNDADIVFVSDIYPAGEAPIEGVDRNALVDGLRARGHRDVRPLPDPDRLAELIAASGTDGDMVVFLGAGTVTNWAQALPDELNQLMSRDTGTEG
ncbi:MAG: UDP-N-acetylmuramate--L-alanine ligase [Rhodospirillaceae bacterium]|jgi:UDP-N-acetylmuramate--alanine ligase|nr:UDP-N-acetylmuramate--L-alanine ligase [Rhodospirillaceae bacterium]MBT3929103.1 UDP-N-acetylmuramate--L-alanine ligase [Rhodospirillaceae bacterium]MBT5358551.1 UDP-N-acetylmuramate--L-alanine ligase [Rhodospirillaceae bacterium]MBT5770875.1 UDP-N-acetylmuramate--L-alanine ligase [Rhodospirillaceae bacterium]MBT6311474.1 UDP-N-acetylmuramate--L-alanine ligase [Rhodospirillaceae bacterium]